MKDQGLARVIFPNVGEIFHLQKKQSGASLNGKFHQRFIPTQTHSKPLIWEPNIQVTTTGRDLSHGLALRAFTSVLRRILRWNLYSAGKCYMEDVETESNIPQ